jgi:hypothetical protein
LNHKRRKGLRLVHELVPKQAATIPARAAAAGSTKNAAWVNEIILSLALPGMFTN